MPGFILDTNHLSWAIRRVSPLRERLREAHRKGFRLGTCWPVLCELEFGILQTADPEEYRRTLKIVLDEVRIWPFDWEVISFFAELSKNAQDKGRILSHVDIVLAAMAKHFQVTVLTTDKDFVTVHLRFISLGGFRHSR